MRARRVTIVDYGMGNIRSLARAFERCGACIEIVAEPETIRQSERLAIPGQGAFGQAMERLGSRGVSDAIRDVASSGRPLLGICLGLQILFERSEEAPGVSGLGLVPGAISLLPAGERIKRPHMGWSAVEYDGPCPVLGANPNGEPFYFVHSFVAQEASDVAIQIATGHHGIPFVAALSRGSLVATQFHPEKSQQAGHRLLSAWLEL